MISFNHEYNVENLQNAANVACIPISKLKYRNNEMRSIELIKIMEENYSVYEKEQESGLKFGFGKDMELDELCQFLESKYPDSNFLNVNKNIDPIILINDRLYDGWKRCILAYAIGQLEVLCACFEVIPYEHYMYITEKDQIEVATKRLENSNILYTTEYMNDGLIVYFESREEVAKFKKILE